MKEPLNGMFTVREMIEYLNDHQIQESEQMIRRYLRQGKIQGVRSSNRKEGWKIPENEVYRYMVAPIYEGTIYEDGIDDETRLFTKVEKLEQQVSELSSENHKLRVKLGLEDPMSF